MSQLRNTLKMIEPKNKPNCAKRMIKIKLRSFAFTPLSIKASVRKGNTKVKALPNKSNKNIRESCFL